MVLFSKLKNQLTSVQESVKYHTLIVVNLQMNTGLIPLSVNEFF